jgi:multiple sugar transport system substrate-binding protein
MNAKQRWAGIAAASLALALLSSACSSSKKTASAPSSAAPSATAPAPSSSAPAAAGTSSSAPAAAPTSSAAAPPASSSGPAPKGTLTFWARDSDSFLTTVVNAYNASQSNIHVNLTLVPQANFVQKLGTAVASNSGPDIAATDLVFAPYFASVGAFKDITDFYNSLPYKSTFDPAHVNQATYKGKIYALPVTAEASVLYYNKTLFAKAHIAGPPTTYAQVEADAKAITALGGGDKGYYFSGACAGCNIFTFAPYIWGSGGDVLDSSGNPTLDTPQVAAALQLYRDMWQAGDIPASAKTDDGSFFSTPFAKGNIGMVTSGAFFTATLKAAKPAVDFGVAPIPGQTSGSSSFAGGDEVAIGSATKNVAAAEAFMTWITSDGQTLIAQKGFAVPIRSDIAASDYVPQDPDHYTLLAAQLQTGKTPYSLVENALFNDGSGPWIQMIQQAVFGNGTIAAAQATAQKSAAAIVAKGPGGS